MGQVMEAQADLQSALGLLRLNGWGQPQEDYLVRSLARLHGMLAVLGSPMYDAETHPEVRVAPVGGAEVRLTDEECEALIHAAEREALDLSPPEHEAKWGPVYDSALTKLRAASVGEGNE